MQSIENNHYKPFKTKEEAHVYLRGLPKAERRISNTAIIRLPYVVLGKDLHIGDYSVIGEMGFGFDPNTWKLSKQGDIRRWNHIGHVVIKDNVEIGNNTCIDRGALDDTIIGKSTKIDNLVHIAHSVKLGERCLVVAGTVIGGSTVIGDNCFIGINASIRDNITIGDNVFIGMGQVVKNDVGDNERITK